MTNEERRQLIGEAVGEASMCWCETPTGIFDSTRASKIVDRVVAALETERVGDVVLWTGEAKAGVAEFMLVKRSGDCPSVCLFPIEYSKVKGKKGSLIFREDK